MSRYPCLWMAWCDTLSAPLDPLIGAPGPIYFSRDEAEHTCCEAECSCRRDRHRVVKYSVGAEKAR